MLAKLPDLPGLTHYAYGLGWVIGRYRERRLVWHNGGIDGFLTQCMLLLDDGIGVAVMTNTSSSGMDLVVACRVLDELLGIEPSDLFSVLKPRYDAGIAGIRAAKAARRVVPGAPPARPLSAYAGEYEHPGYGTLAIALDGDALKPSLGTMNLNLAHRHYETFDLEWHETSDQPAVFPLTFLAAPDGDANAPTGQFEPLVEPLRFDRRPDTQSPEILRPCAGGAAPMPWARSRSRSPCVASARSPSRHPPARPAGRQAAPRPSAHQGPALRREGPARDHSGVRTRRQRRGHPAHRATPGDLPPEGSKLGGSRGEAGRTTLACRSATRFTGPQAR